MARKRFITESDRRKFVEAMREINREEIRKRYAKGGSRTSKKENSEQHKKARREAIYERAGLDAEARHLYEDSYRKRRAYQIKNKSNSDRLLSESRKEKASKRSSIQSTLRSSDRRRVSSLRRNENRTLPKNAQALRRLKGKRFEDSGVGVEEGEVQAKLYWDDRVFRRDTFEVYGLVDRRGNFAVEGDRDLGKWIQRAVKGSSFTWEDDESLIVLIPEDSRLTPDDEFQLELVGNVDGTIKYATVYVYLKFENDKWSSDFEDTWDREEWY